jgi:hypothetical protein
MTPMERFIQKAGRALAFAKIKIGYLKERIGGSRTTKRDQKQDIAAKEPERPNKTDILLG